MYVPSCDNAYISRIKTSFAGSEAKYGNRKCKNNKNIQEDSSSRRNTAGGGGCCCAGAGVGFECLNKRQCKFSLSQQICSTFAQAQRVMFYITLFFLVKHFITYFICNYRLRRTGYSDQLLKLYVYEDMIIC